MNRNSAQSAGEIIDQIDGLTVVGWDIAKSVFHASHRGHGHGEIVNVQLKRAKLLEHFVGRAPRLIAIEACGSAHH